MNLKKRKVVLVFIGIVLLLFLIPFNFFKANIFIEFRNELNDRNINTSIKRNVNYIIGSFSNEKEIELKKDNRLTVNKSSILDLGIYSKLMLELTLQSLVDGEKIKTNIKAKSVVWGFGKLKIKENNFKKTIIKRIDELYLEN
jgi:hypothetical protein